MERDRSAGVAVASLNVAVSLIGLPIVVGAVALVTIAGCTWLTTLDSLASPHVPVGGELLASPL